MLGQCLPNRYAEGAEWGGVWGRVSRPQPTRVLGSVVSSPAWSWAEPQPETHFGVFWRPQNAPFCTHMPMLWVSSSNSVSCHIGDKAEIWGNCPLASINLQQRLAYCYIKVMMPLLNILSPFDCVSASESVTQNVLNALQVAIFRHSSANLPSW